MTSRSSVRALAAALAGVIAVSAGAASAADPARLARTQAECDKIRAGFQNANHKAQQNRDVETEALTNAAKAAETADMVRKMTMWEVSMRRLKMEAEYQRIKALRDEEERGAAYSPTYDPSLIKIRVLIDALKDAELRGRDIEETGGMIGSDRNALDGFAQTMRDKAAQAKAKAEEWDRKAKDGQRAHQDCLAEVERQRAALESPDDGDQYASAGGGGDDYGDDYAGGYSSGGYDDIGSDAYPAGPTYRPPRARPPRGPRPDRWTASTGYADPGRVRGGRNVRGDGGRRDNGVRAEGRDPRDGRRNKGGGQRGKGGKSGGSHCHANPLTGQQHCGDG